jgi:hypothetical protein
VIGGAGRLLSSNDAQNRNQALPGIEIISENPFVTIGAVVPS